MFSSKVSAQFHQYQLDEKQAVSFTHMECLPRQELQIEAQKSKAKVKWAFKRQGRLSALCNMTPLGMPHLTWGPEGLQASRSRASRRRV